MSLTSEQEIAFYLFLSGKSMFITGPGGCGKSFLIKHIMQHCHENMVPLGVTALTGAAASLIKGQTLHGWAGIGKGQDSAKDIAARLYKRPATYKQWKSVKVLIIDEISMMSAGLFNKLHLIAQSVRKNTAFFGGIQLVLCGDFAQLAPIESNKFCFESSIWKKHVQENTIYLNRIIRQDDPVFQRILTNLRLGRLSTEDKRVLNTRLITDESEAEIELTDEDGNVIEGRTIKATILFPKRKDVNRINELELKKLLRDGAQSKVYKSADYLVDRKTRMPRSMKPQHVGVLNKCTNAVESITLAVGAQVMLVKNKCLEDGLVNGSRGVVVEIDGAGNPVVIFDNGQELTVLPESFEVESGSNMIVRKQVPLILAWALTIHKCQGSTLTNVITDLSGVFDYAQIYVTLSRVKSLDGLFIVSINYAKATCNPKVRKYYDSLEK